MVASLWQLSVSSQHMVKSLTWFLIWAYVIWNFAPIFGQQISILDPLTLDFLVRLGLNFHPMGELRGGGRLGLRYFFYHGRTETWLLKSTQPCIFLGSLNRVPALIGWGNGGNITSAGWQVTLCLSLIHIWRCRRSTLCRSRWSPYH